MQINPNMTSVAKLFWPLLLFVLWHNAAHANSYKNSPWTKAGNSEVAKGDLDSILQEDMFEPPQEEGEFTTAAEIIILDKRLGKPSKPKIIERGKDIEHDTLKISLESCWRSKQEKWGLDSRALLKINIKGRAGNTGQSSWFFSKLPSLSRFEHERYDILLQKCR
jgi:hypothetical protein